MHSSHVNPYVTRRPAILGLAKVLLIAIAQLPIITAAPTPFSGILSKREEDAKPSDDPELWLYLVVAAALVLAGGAFAGLTIALMGQVRGAHQREHRQVLLTGVIMYRMRSIFRSSRHPEKGQKRRMRPAS